MFYISTYKKAGSKAAKGQSGSQAIDVAKVAIENANEKRVPMASEIVKN